MNFTLTNIDKFVEQLIRINDTNLSDLFEQYYYFETKEKTNIYNQLIINLNSDFRFDNITAEEKQKYRDCFSFLTSEIKRAKTNYQTVYNNQIKKINDNLMENKQRITNALININNYNNDIATLNNKKISKWKNNILKFITFSFWDWNRNITVEQETIQTYITNNTKAIPTFQSTIDNNEEELATITNQLLKDNEKLDNSIEELKNLEQEFENRIVPITNNIITCEIAEEAKETIDYQKVEEELETLTIKRSNSYDDETDEDFESNSNSDSDNDENYPETLNPFADNYHSPDSEPITFTKKVMNLLGM